jgi:hypothetical protein
MNPDIVIILGISTFLMALLINAAERIIHRKDEKVEGETKEHDTIYPTVLPPSIYYGPVPDFIQHEEDRRSSGCLLLLIMALIALIAVLIYYKINYLS